MTTGEWFVLIPLNQGLFLNAKTESDMKQVLES
ncbi:Uncharacterised protein [Cardiobacterium valvarum]|uniref:Uncharacterized protein n=1 Tax=Cardiobacterium valvarum TaxID=194702 RepID=A0A381ECG0_9GAMM|nr:Uncharacterised protein [Cardiobacterium valvarum]